MNVAIELTDELIEHIAQRVAQRMGPRDDDSWLDAVGAAEYLAIPRSTLHKLTSAAAIPFSQDVPGGKLYFKRSALDAWRG
jgi:excisionase family DNA binding protein